MKSSDQRNKLNFLNFFLRLKKISKDMSTLQPITSLPPLTAPTTTPQDPVYNIGFLDPATNRIINSQIKESTYWETQANMAIFDVTYFD